MSHEQGHAQCGFCLGLQRRPELRCDQMLLMAPYCFHIGVAISFATFFYREIKDNRSL